ncbi:hypothetical protein [Mesorhizobium sp. 113-1-2]|uniref:hypothetical protein n=1 Tax=Mesorhizobium sp. 113-1-2 TaxID=2744515 RepID=UPI001927CE03|nr:hypothetical protein [Mesorhizobium sp. 113-1-2]
MTADILNTIGLTMGMLGVVLIFIWGPPLPDFEETVSLAIQPATVLADGTKISDIIAANQKRKRRHKIISSIGLGLIFFGYGAQLCALWTTH